MPRPIALCIELVDGTDAPRYVRCVADLGRPSATGLSIDARGEVAWQTREGLACELFATADDRLALLRPTAADAVTIDRAGRVLDVPFARPVILRDKDELIVGGRRLRLHVHGVANTITPPVALLSGNVRRVAAAAATALALGAAALACKRGGDASDGNFIEVRDQPPQVPAFGGDDASDVGDVGGASGDSQAATSDGIAESVSDRAASDASDAGERDAGDGSSRDAAAGSAATRDGGKAPSRTEPPEIDVRDMPPYVE